jgi:hypothetical protein
MACCRYTMAIIFCSQPLYTYNQAIRYKSLPQLHYVPPWLWAFASPVRYRSGHYYPSRIALQIKSKFK